MFKVTTSGSMFFSILKNKQITQSHFKFFTRFTHSKTHLKSGASALEAEWSRAFVAKMFFRFIMGIDTGHVREDCLVMSQCSVRDGLRGI